MPSYHPQRIEPKWQAYWEQNKTFRADDLVPGKPKLYVLDMFPYPSGAGLHVGHPEGYTATDILCRYKRMRGFNVLHPMGWDAFGLPAEQYAIQTGTHPRITTAENIDNFRRQIKSLGFSYDWDREVDTTDPDYYKWTQWIFLQLFDTWYDPDFEWIDPQGQPRTGQGPADRRAADPRRARPTPTPTATRSASPIAPRCRSTGAPSWAPCWPTRRSSTARASAAGTRSSACRCASGCCGSPPTPSACSTTSRPSTGPADQGHAAQLDRPQRRGRGRFPRRRGSALGGAVIGWPETPGDDVIRVFTTRPDTLFGATYMVLAPEHPLVDRIDDARAARRGRRLPRRPPRKSDLDRTDLAKTKTGVFTGAYAINPVNGQQIPIWIADYVLMGYGTGAIMAVPGPRRARLRVRQDVRPADRPRRRPLARPGRRPARPTAEPEPGVAVNSRERRRSRLDGLPTAEAKAAITAWLEQKGLGRKTVNYKLRDWLFSRQRYWGEPFPIVLDEHDRAHAVPESELPVLLPELDDFKPIRQARAAAGQGDGLGPLLRQGSAARPTRCPSGPARAGTTCATSTRRTTERPWDPEKERYWMPVDLYVGGAEHAVLHLLYSRFWHKVLFDRGHVSTPEPFQRLVNQGMILGEIEYTGYRDAAGRWVSADAVEDDEHGIVLEGPTGPSRPSKLARRAGRQEGRRLRPGRRRRRSGSTPAPTRCRRAGATSSTPTRSSRSTAPTACGSTRCSWDRSKRSSPGA